MQSCAARCNDPLLSKIYNLLQHEEEFLANDRKSILRIVRNSIFKVATSGKWVVEVPYFEVEYIFRHLALN